MTAGYDNFIDHVQKFGFYLFFQFSPTRISQATREMHEWKPGLSLPHMQRAVHERISV